MSKKSLRVAKTLINVGGRAYGEGSQFEASDDELKHLPDGSFNDVNEKSASRSVAGGETIVATPTAAPEVTPRAPAKKPE